MQDYHTTSYFTGNMTTLWHTLFVLARWPHYLTLYWPDDHTASHCTDRWPHYLTLYWPDDHTTSHCTVQKTTHLTLWSNNSICVTFVQQFTHFKQSSQPFTTSYTRRAAMCTVFIQQEFPQQKSLMKPLTRFTPISFLSFKYAQPAWKFQSEVWSGWVPT